LNAGCFEDLADELYEFFRFKLWNDLSEEEEQKQNLTDEELESSILLRPPCSF
jgi:hypothetical protein